MTTIEELQETAKRYETIRLELNGIISTINPVEMVTPANLAEVKKEWIKRAKEGYFENPVFIYDRELLAEVAGKREALCKVGDEFRRKLRHWSDAEEFLYLHYNNVADDAIASVSMAEAMLERNDIRLRRCAFYKYGKPTLVARASTLIRNPPEKGDMEFPQEMLRKLEEATLGASFIKEIFIWSMEQYGVEPWPVEILENCFAIDVRDKNSSGKPMIAIPASRKVNGLKLAELVGHEIECHWRTSQNIMSIGCMKADDELVYEGIAKVKDMAFQKKTTGEATMPSPYYVLAEDTASHRRSFAEVAHAVFNVTGSVQKAWTFAYRTFRGIADTNNEVGYAFTKDRAYLEGLYYVQEMAKAEMHPYLNFGSLGRKDFENLIRLVDRESIAKYAMVDLDIQSKVLYEIEKRL